MARIPADEMVGRTRRRDAQHRVGTELLGALYRVRRGRGVEPEETVRVVGGRGARSVGRAELRARRGEPRLACVRVEAGLEEGRERGLARGPRRRPLHTRARRGALIGGGTRCPRPGDIALMRTMTHSGRRPS
jgi:hypothetical protein